MTTVTTAGIAELLDRGAHVIVLGSVTATNITWDPRDGTPHGANLQPDDSAFLSGIDPAVSDRVFDASEKRTLELLVERGGALIIEPPARKSAFDFAVVPRSLPTGMTDVPDGYEVTYENGETLHLTQLQGRFFIAVADQGTTGWRSFANVLWSVERDIVMDQSVWLAITVGLEHEGKTFDTVFVTEALEFIGNMVCQGVATCEPLRRGEPAA